MNHQTTTVRDLAVAIPGATRIFERHRIDYCCGGRATLADACATRGVDVDAIVAELRDAAARAQSDDRGWEEAPLRALVAHLVDKHHAYTRDEIARLTPLLDKIVRVHGERHPEFDAIRRTFAALAADLGPHLDKEERILFPFIQQLDGDRRAPAPPFGSVRYPIGVMSLEHDVAGDLLRELRALTGDYTPPADACGSVSAVFAGLAAFERDLHEHIHLENNVLFPRALEKEEEG